MVDDFYPGKWKGGIEEKVCGANTDVTIYSD